MRVAELFSLVEQDYELNQRTSLYQTRCHCVAPRRLIGERDAATLTFGDVEAYKVARLKEGAARGTICRELAILRRGYTLAVDFGKLPPEARPKITMFQLNNARTGFLEPPDFLRLCSTLQVLDHNVRDVTEWAYSTGWRKEEILGLTWAEVSLAEGRVQLPQGRVKNRKGRLIRCGAALVAILKKRDACREGQYVFHRHGKKIKRFDSTWQRAVEAIGQPDLIFHSLRRSFARNALAALWPMKLVMTVGGWSTISTFLRYCMFNEQEISDGFDALDAFVQKKRKTSP